VRQDPDVGLVNLRFSADAGMMASDGFHPGAPIYSEWAERAVRIILARETNAGTDAKME
jgi:hypothetical protein